MTVNCTICLKCGTLADSVEGRTVHCHQCDFKIPRDDYATIITFGSEVIRFGVHYRRRYEHDLKTNGIISSHYCLPEPSAVIAFVGAAIAAGIIGNLAYDVIKICFRGLANALKSRKSQLSKERFYSKETFFASLHDLDLLLRLLDDEEFANQLKSDIEDYLNGMPGANPEVRAVVIHEETIHRDVAAARKLFGKLTSQDKSRHVHVNPTGTRYHTANCPKLRSESRQISLRDAKEKYLACKVCKPDGG